MAWRCARAREWACCCPAFLRAWTRNSSSSCAAARRASARRRGWSCSASRCRATRSRGRSTEPLPAAKVWVQPAAETAPAHALAAIRAGGVGHCGGGVLPRVHAPLGRLLPRFGKVGGDPEAGKKVRQFWRQRRFELDPVTRGWLDEAQACRVQELARQAGHAAAAIQLIAGNRMPG